MSKKVRAIMRISQGSPVPDGWHIVSYLTKEKVKTLGHNYVVDVVVCERG